MDVSQILPSLFVGSFPGNADDMDRLRQDFGITAVLSVQTDDDMAYWGLAWSPLEALYRDLGIEVRRVPVRDFDPDDLRAKLPESVVALDELLRAGHTVYVHCSAGINRSPSVVIAYLHWVLGWDLDKAVQYVTSRRRCDPYVEAIRRARWDRTGQK
jgi:protein-tyrosine phosphatase